MESHLNRMLDYGRGTYSYAGRNRIWSYTIGTLGKMSISLQQLTNSLSEANIKAFPTTLELPDVNRFQLLRKQDRTFGLWILRQDNRSTVLPIVGNAALSDYLPIPYGLAGIEAPVSQRAPILVPFIELADGRQLTTAQGADAVALDEAENSLHLSWGKWSSLRGEILSIPIQAKVVWQIKPEHVIYRLELIATKHMQLKNWQFWVPLSYAAFDPETNTFSNPAYQEENGQHPNHGNMQLSFNSNLPLNESLLVTQNSELGKGGFHPVPFLFKLENQGITLEKDKPYHFELELSFAKSTESMLNK